MPLSRAHSEPQSDCLFYMSSWPSLLVYLKVNIPKTKHSAKTNSAYDRLPLSIRPNILASSWKSHCLLCHIHYSLANFASFTFKRCRLQLIFTSSSTAKPWSLPLMHLAWNVRTFQLECWLELYQTFKIATPDHVNINQFNSLLCPKILTWHPIPIKYNPNSTETSKPPSLLSPHLTSHCLSSYWPASTVPHSYWRAIVYAV